MADLNELHNTETTAPDDGAVVSEEVMPSESVDFPEEAIEAPEMQENDAPFPKRETISKRTILVLSLMAAVILSLFALIIGILIGRTGAVRSGSELLSEGTARKLSQMQEIISKYFLFESDDADYEAGVLHGYMNALEDPYSVYYTPEEYVGLMESTTGTFTGIGVVVQQEVETGYVRVVRPYHNCPGEQAGIREGDIILEVDGVSTTGVDLNIVVSWIKGEEGTSVHLTILRPSTGEQFEADVKRAKIEVETISSKMLDNDIGYIQMESFDEVTYQQFMSAFNGLKQAGMKGLIVDIRNNGGGLLSSVVDILDELLPKGIITYTEDKNGNRKNYESDADSVLDVPMAVLVNEYSASASEIFTGALKDYGAATIVGKTTFGKGIVQVILPLDDGSAVKITTSRYFTPNGVCIHEIGIDPDIAIEDDPETEEDDPLEAAIKAVLEKIGE